MLARRLPKGKLSWYNARHVNLWMLAWPKLPRNCSKWRNNRLWLSPANHAKTQVTGRSAGCSSRILFVVEDPASLHCGIPISAGTPEHFSKQRIFTFGRERHSRPGEKEH